MEHYKFHYKLGSKQNFIEFVFVSLNCSFVESDFILATSWKRITCKEEYDWAIEKMYDQSPQNPGTFHLLVQNFILKNKQSKCQSLRKR